MVKKIIFPDELIGEEIEVIQASNKHQERFRGKVVDETRSTLKVEIGGQTKTLLKRGLTLKLLRNGKIIAGADLLKRPEERIKG